MQIKHIHIENFRSIKEFDADFNGNTLVSGANEVGKSTIRNAIFYVLLNRLADGSSPDNIRPHDKEGKDIDNVDITVELTLDINGQEVTLKKTEKQKWTKHRGSESPTFEGNVTSYEISGIPKKQKDYQAFIDSLIDSETLLYGTNAQAFLGLDQKKRRAKLMTLASDKSLEDIAKQDSKYEPLLPMFQYGTIDELLARSRKIIKEKNEELKMIPVRIDEISKQLVEVDTASLEQQRKQLKEEIAKVEAEMSSGNNKAMLDELGQKKMTLMFDMNEAKRQAHEVLMSKRHNLNSRVSALEISEEGITTGISNMKRQISMWEKTIAENTAKIEELKPEYAEAKNSSFDESKWVFDDSTTICSLCGQVLPQDKIEALKSEFNAKKEKEKNAFEVHRKMTIERIKEDGNSRAQENTELKKKVAEKNGEIEEKEKVLELARQELAKVKSELALLPTDIDLDKIENYQTLKKELIDVETQIKALETATSDNTVLESKKDSLEQELEHINEQMAKVHGNADIEQRIVELTAQQRTVAQEIADEEKTRDLLESLNRLYVEVTTDAINSHFRFIKWKMFKQNITNSGYEAICEPTYNGTGYFKGLNHGARLLCEIDLCMAFQNMAGKKLFITLDDAESVDSWRLPELDRQLIVFRRTDDKELKVKLL